MNDNFPKSIQMARKRANLSKVKAAQLCDTPYQTYCGYERGYRKPRFEVVLKIASLLDVDPKELIDDYGVLLWLANNLPRPHSDIEIQISESLEKLNDSGKQEAAKRIKEMTEICRYRRCDGGKSIEE